MVHPSARLPKFLIQTAATVVFAHGMAHLPGIGLSFSRPGSAVGYTVGALWLLAAVAFVATSELLARHNRRWRQGAILGLVLSTPLLILQLVSGSGPVLAGAAVDIVIAVGVCGSWAMARPAHGTRSGHVAPRLLLGTD
jgi:hypothetical protein